MLKVAADGCVPMAEAVSVVFTCYNLERDCSINRAHNSDRLKKLANALRVDVIADHCLLDLLPPPAARELLNTVRIADLL